MYTYKHLFFFCRYHMFGEDIHRLRVLLLQSSQSQPEPAVTVVFQRDGNYGDNWNYGQVTFNLTTQARVSDTKQEVRRVISLLILIYR